MSTPDTDLDAQSGLRLLWADRAAAPSEVPAGFLTMIDTMRELQDRLTAAAPPAAVVAEVTTALRGVADLLGEYEVGERKQLAGRLRHLPGRGQVLIPPLVLTHADGQSSRGHVTFGRLYLGANGAVHGGALPLVFDDLLGKLANAGDRVPARTARLRVDYRSITPIDRELQVHGWLEREEGRKRYLRGTVHAGDVLCAEADALFVALRPGQP